MTVEELLASIVNACRRLEQLRGYGTGEHESLKEQISALKVADDALWDIVDALWGIVNAHEAGDYQ